MRCNNRFETSPVTAVLLTCHCVVNTGVIHNNLADKRSPMFTNYLQTLSLSNIAESSFKSSCRPFTAQSCRTSSCHLFSFQYASFSVSPPRSQPSRSVPVNTRWRPTTRRKTPRRSRWRAATWCSWSKRGMTDSGGNTGIHAEKIPLPLCVALKKWVFACVAVQVGA